MFKEIKRDLRKKQLIWIINGIVAELFFMVPASCIDNSGDTVIDITLKILAFGFRTMPVVCSITVIISLEIKFRNLLNVLNITSDEEADALLEQSEKLNYGCPPTEYLVDETYISFSNLVFFNVSEIVKLKKINNFTSYEDEISTETTCNHHIRIIFQKPDHSPKKYLSPVLGEKKRDEVFRKLLDVYSKYGNPNDII